VHIPSERREIGEVLWSDDAVEQPESGIEEDAREHRTQHVAHREAGVFHGSRSGAGNFRWRRSGIWWDGWDGRMKLCGRGGVYFSLLLADKGGNRGASEVGAVT
jgi:hypothetical protein